MCPFEYARPESNTLPGGNLLNLIDEAGPDLDPGYDSEVVYGHQRPRIWDSERDANGIH